jgi:membrane protein DedA with SNARE-associated domain/membrane-associated phospholipid phosphatase
VSPGRVTAAVAAAVLVGAALVRRRQLGRERALVALLLAAALGVYASGVLSALPDPEKLIEDVARALGKWTYALVGGMAFLETGAFIGFIAPGEFTVILGGVIAGSGEIDIVLLIGIVWACEVLGDSTSFLIGSKLGRSFLLKHGPKLKITRERFEQVERYLARHGGKTILIGRFLGFVRPLAPFIAGSSRMRYRRFLPYSVLGTGLWGATFCLAGYIFWHSFDQVTKIAGRATVAFALLVGLIGASVYAYRRLRHEEERRRLAAWLERQGRRPLLRPIAAVLRPLWRRALRPAWRLAAPRLRFLWRRLTPGGLGIELTTTMALAAGGLYVFGLYTATLASDPGLTPADRQLLDLADDLRAQGVVDVAKVVSVFGSLPVTAGLVAVAALLLAVRRHPAEMLALVLGFVAIVAAVHIAKAGIDRPRPARSLTRTVGSSFPSGHAAYSIAYIAMGVIAARVLPGLVSRAALVASTIGAAAVIGLSRLYLRAHFWSDVAGGWALGLGLFGLAGAVTLLVVHLRQNATQAAPADGRAAASTTRG